MMAGASIMKDSYVGGIVSSSCIQQEADASPFSVDEHTKESCDNKADDKSAKPKSANAWHTERSNNQTDEDKLTHLTVTDDTKTSNINKTEEYNIGYTGFSILPWEEFVFNPRALNDLFYAESNNKITFDPDEVNVFFHGKNVMPPTVGDISENGKSWNIVIDNMSDLRKIRTWLTEKSSVFGVTLEYKGGRFAKPERAPCLVLMDPTKGSIGDKIYTSLTRAMDALHNDKNFSVEINLNGCVERWCRRVLLTDCKAVGAKIVITNGEEYESLDGAEDVICCIFCFPVWLIQTCVYKLHRKVVYDDFMINFDADDMFLHGSIQDSQCQRQFIFNESGEETVFRTRCAEQTDVKTLEALGSHKFVCIKKVDKSDSEDKITEHNTTTFGDLVNKRKTKVLKKDPKLRKQVKRKDTDKSKYSDTDGLHDGSMTIPKGANGSTAKSQKPFTNKGFVDDDNFDNAPQGGGTTPRIPEISSVPCGYDESENDNIELDIPSEIKNDDSSLFSPRTESNDSILEPLPKLDFRRRRDNKSMTAICSFEFNGSDADQSNSDTDDDWSEVRGFTQSKENLIDELAKIDQSLPAVNKMYPSEDELSNDTQTHGTAGNKQDVKGGDKPKIGKVLKELTKTTTGADSKEDCPSKNDERYKQAKENIKQQKNKAKLKEGVTDDDKTNKKSIQGDANNSLGAGAQMGKGEDTDKKGYTDDTDDNDSAVAFTVDDSSTDGDEVEMIYQSKQEETANAGSVGIDNSNKLKVPEVGRRTPSPIQVVATNNTPILDMNNVKPRYNVTGTDCDIFYDDDEQIDATKKDVKVDSGRPIPLVVPKGIVKTRNSLGVNQGNVFEIEQDVALADIDEEGNEITNTNGAKVPSLKFHSGPIAVKKAKRGTKRNDSSGRYLGGSVPAKSKKMPR